MAALARLQGVRWRSESGLRALRLRKLRRVVRHAYTRVPYYRARMDEAGIRPEDIATLDDLRRIPVTTKEDLRRAGEAALSAAASELVTVHTSGYSGQPFAVQLTLDELRTRRLREFRALLRAGVRPRDRLVVLGPDRPRPQRLHRRLGLYRSEVIRGSSSVQEQTRRLRQANPTVLWVYPTVLRSVLLMQDDRLSRVARPRILITSSEVLDPLFRDKITADCPVELFSFYGATEVGRIAAECRAHEGLHIETDAVIVELLDGDRPVARREPGSVVVTSLDQYAMPFIRYDLGDLCAATATTCPCGWPTPLLDLPMGRNADMVTMPDGGRVSGLRLSFVLRTEPDLWQYRFLQEAADRIEAQLAYGRAPSPERLADVTRRLEEALGGRVRVDVRLVDHIPWDGGKFKNVVSSLPAAWGPNDPLRPRSGG